MIDQNHSEELIKEYDSFSKLNSYSDQWCIKAQLTSIKFCKFEGMNLMLIDREGTQIPVYMKGEDARKWKDKAKLSKIYVISGGLNSI